jgi:hypothetical protein
MSFGAFCARFISCWVLDWRNANALNRVTLMVLVLLVIVSGIAVPLVVYGARP